MGEFKTGRISLRSTECENKTGRIQSCIQYLFHYTECPISTTNFTALRHCLCDIKNCHPANRPIRLLEINMRYNNFECHTVFTMAIEGRVTFKQMSHARIYARTVRTEKPMAAVAAFLATS